MFKVFVLGIHIFSLFLWGIIQPQRVTITDDVPDRMAPGEEVVVTVTIDKSDVSGFAKYQVSLSDELVAEPVQTAGASFTFHDGEAKFIWMTLPGDKEFKLTYRLLAKENASGKAEVTSRFSYIHENKRYNYDAPNSIIQIGDETADKTPVEPPQGTATAAVTANRHLTPEDVNQWKVVVEIDKSALDGFAKVEETIPAGYTAIDLKSSSAVFTSDGQTVKYVWYDIPQRETVTVIYKLLPVIALDGEKPEITGAFSYLKGDETQSIPITEEGFADLAEETTAAKDTSGAEVSDVAALTGREEAEPEVEKTTAQEAETTEPETRVEHVEPPKTETEATAQKEKPVDKKTDEAPAKEEESVTKKAYTDANIVDVPAPEKGVFYRVQIAAGKNNLKHDVFVKLYVFDEGFKLESIGGWFKYTTGHHTVYKQARNDRVRITGKYDKFKGPFVTAYNDGERITVQEALMITEQKWIP